MGSKLCKSSDAKTDPDEVWSNQYREKEKNNIYRWGASDGDLVKKFEQGGEEAVLRFATEKLEPQFFPGGARKIELADYVNWKKRLAIELGMSEAHSVNLEDRFKEHKALSRLNERGAEGETVLHVLLHNEDTMCHEVARILIKRYPKMSGDVYMGDSMHGQSALHLAIVHDDYETAALLLEAGADVNARACGDFFMPDLWKTKRRVGNYSGLAYFGEYPIAFAACLGNRDIYDLLLEHHADPNLQDSFGNTVLHMCVISNSISMYSYAVGHRKKAANPLILNEEGYTALTLASVLGRKEIFEQMLELSKVEFWRFSTMTCSAYPIAALDSINVDGSTNYDSALIKVINGTTEEHLDIVGTDVVQKLLDYKWKAFAKVALYRRMIMIGIQVLCLSLAAGLRPTELDRLYFLSDNSTLDEGSFHTGKRTDSFGPRTDDWFRLVFEGICYVLSIQYVFQQIFEIKAQGAKTFVKNMASTPARCVYSFSNILLILCLPCRILRFTEIEECLLVIGVPGTLFYCLFFARSFKLTGPFVQIFYTMIGTDLAIFSIISFIFMIPFSFVLGFLGENIDAKDDLPIGNPWYCKRDELTIYFSYSTKVESFITLLRAMLKGFDYEELDCLNYEYFAKGMMLLYLLTQSIMMMTLLIAMITNTFTKVIQRAEKAWRKQAAMIIMNLERSLDSKSLAKHVMSYSITLHENTEARGLLVIKETRASKTLARVKASRHWRLLGRKVKEIIVRMGVEKATEALHSHQSAILELERPPSRKVETIFGGIANVVSELMEFNFSPRNSVTASGPSASPLSRPGTSARPDTSDRPVHVSDIQVIRPITAKRIKTTENPIGVRQRGVSFADISAPNLPPAQPETFKVPRPHTRNV